MMARAGSRSTFKDGHDDLKIYAGIEVSAKDIERVAERIGADMEHWSQKQREALIEPDIPVQAQKTIPIMYISYDGTGVPMIASELEGRKGKQPDGSSKTREMKLGCVFTQTTTDPEGFPIRDPETTTFVGAIEPAEQFGKRIYAEAVRRGLPNAEKVVVLGDGAEWIKNLAELHFPEAIQIGPRLSLDDCRAAGGASATRNVQIPRGRSHWQRPRGPSGAARRRGRTGHPRSSIHGIRHLPNPGSRGAKGHHRLAQIGARPRAPVPDSLFRLRQERRADFPDHDRRGGHPESRRHRSRSALGRASDGNDCAIGPLLSELAPHFAHARHSLVIWRDDGVRFYPPSATFPQARRAECNRHRPPRRDSRRNSHREVLHRGKT